MRFVAFGMMLFFFGCATPDLGAPFVAPPAAREEVGDHVPCMAPDCKLVFSEEDAKRVAIDARGVDFKHHFLIVLGAGGERYEAEAIDIDDAVVVHTPIDLPCASPTKGVVLRVPRIQKPLLIQRFRACP